MTFTIRPEFRVEHITVNATTMDYPERPAVSLEVEGQSVNLTPDNARRLSVALLEHAAAAERAPGQSEWP